MYGAMRERALASTRMAGGATALTITGALALAVAIGMGGHALAAPEEPLMFTVMPEEVVQPPPEMKRDFDMAAEPTLVVVQPEINIFFEVEDPPIRVTREPEARPTPGIPKPSETVIPTPPKPPGVRTGAKIIPAAAPPYPPSAIRRGDEGISTLEICLDAGGRVTSAKLANTSGHDVLDEAALKWVRTAKFTPAKLDGVAQAVCGHAVSYEWNLNGHR